jgi:hypothetical protein
VHLIYQVLKKNGGRADGEGLIAAAKRMKWESPRGPISIDPGTRDVVQTVYELLAGLLEDYRLHFGTYSCFYNYSFAD